MSELIYLLAAVLFILSIRGLSAPRSARLGNFLGIAGMTLAIVAALALIPPERLLPVVLALAAGGVIGVVSGQKVRMTALPQMIAAFNGLGGLAAVFLAAGEAAADGTHYFASSVGLVIGALAFSGSMVAFAKLEGLLPGKALLFPFQHPLNLLLSIITVLLFFRLFLHSCRMDVLAFGRGFFAARSAFGAAGRRRRHADCHLRLKLLFRLGGGRHRFHA